MEAAGKIIPTDSVSAWQNRLHDWILRSDEFASLGAGLRQTLQQMTNQARRMPSGDLVGTRGGAGLIRAIGVARSTFWRHLKRLEQLGFVVPLTRGGNRAGHTAEASTYGIPAELGGLDHVRAARERRVAHRDGETADGRPRYVPHTIEPGEQLMLWRTGSDLQPSPDPPSQSRCIGTTSKPGEGKGPLPGGHGSVKPGGDPVSKRDGTRVKMRRDPCQNDTGPVSKRDTSIFSSSSNPSKHHGVSSGALEQEGPNKPWLTGVTREDLTEIGRLLALHGRAIALGLSSRASDDLLIFVTLAERALRVTAKNRGDPTKLFPTLVALGREGQKKYLTAGDDLRAADRLRRWSMTPAERACERERTGAVPMREADRDEVLS